MSEKILVNATPGETRVAVIDDETVQEVHIERKSNLSIIGNIYKGKVARVLPGIQAAFVDIGLERTAFLHEDDVLNSPVTEGQEILVQTFKDPIGTKGARLTMRIAIPSRHLVLTPYMNTVNISAKIIDPIERARLLRLLSAEPLSNQGFIVRTSAEGLDSLQQDLNYLQNQWHKISNKYRIAKVGDLIYQDLSLTLRVIRDLVNNNTSLIVSDNIDNLHQIKQFIAEFIPEFNGNIEIQDQAQPIFDLYGVEHAILKALQKNVTLKSGGYLIIEQSEAMTTIDVNTGAFVGRSSLEETVYKTNLEAASVIAHQVRLRNLGGIIIIDFIDMIDLEHRNKVLDTLRKELAHDYVKITISELSSLGLVQMTRKRTRESLKNCLCAVCPACDGQGFRLSLETLGFDIFREATKIINSVGDAAIKILIIAAPEVIDILVAGEMSIVSELENGTNKVIQLQAEPQYSYDQFDMVVL